MRRDQRASHCRNKADGNGGEFQYSSGMNSPSDARKLRCGICREVSKMAPILSLGTVSINSRVSRHPPSERLNGVEATLVSDRGRVDRRQTNKEKSTSHLATPALPRGFLSRGSSFEYLNINFICELRDMVFHFIGGMNFLLSLFHRTILIHSASIN